jgi:spermidine synthase
LSRITTATGNAPASWPQVYLGVAFTTMATLLLELAMTRIFSVVFYYHFAFLAISIALFGLGAGGVFSYVVAARRGELFDKLGQLSLLNAVVPVVSLVFLLTRGEELGNFTLAAVYFFSALPFFVAGAIVSLAISETIERVDRVYFYDLLGAAGGCLLLIPLLNTLGGPNTVMAAAVLFAVAGGVWYNLGERRGMRAAAVALALGLVAFITYNAKEHWVDVKHAKGQTLDNELFVKWNSFSRIAIAREKQSGQVQIVIDADASTGIADFDLEHLTERQKEDLTLQGPAFPYMTRPAAKTLIIGPGGGWDVARALATGSRDITGVEINPIIANTIMRERFAYMSRRLYHRPDVHIHVEDGRSFVRRSPEKYQVLQATLVDTWASTAAGAFALSENNLYTTDAFYDYLSHLTDDGVVAITRWGFEPPRESVRLLTLAREALARLGEDKPWRHVMVVREGSQKELENWGARDTVLISRKPFSDADVARAEEIIARARMQKVYLPGTGTANAFGQALLAKNLDAWLDAYPFDVSPVGDDRPFFFYTVQPRDVWAFVTSMNKDSADYKINRAVPMLFSVVGVSLLATLIILALPPVLLGTRLPREEGVLRFLMYFLCIGVGYILIQVALIQKFVLFLGHPTYALTVIIFSMLVASGLGSFASRKFVGDDDGKLGGVLAIVAILVAVLAFAAAEMTSALVGMELGWKMALTAGVIAPVAFFMGMPFPQGLARLETFHKPSVRWAWSLNAAASVLGSAGAIFLAIYLGLRQTLLLGGLLYLGALFVLKSTQKIRSHVA